MDSPAPNARAVAPRRAAPAAPAETTLLLSFVHRDTMADALAMAGCRVVAARRAEGIARRFLSLDCRLAVVDARDCAPDALDAVALLGPAVRSTGGALLLLYDRADAALLPAFAKGGASQFLAAPWHEGELTAALHLALFARVGSAPADLDGGQCWWQADLRTGIVSVDAASDTRLRAMMSVDDKLPALVARLSPPDRARAFDAVRKLQERGGYAAFVQRDVVGVPGEFVHHLMLHGQRLSGQVEWVNPRAMVAGRLGRDALTGLLDRDIATSLIDTARDGPAARIGASLIQLAGLDRYNDVAGRAAGDALLRAVGRQLDRVVRQDMGREAIVARVGGSRFAVLLAGAESAGKLDVELRAVAASLNEALLTPAHRSLAFRIATGLTEEGESVDALLGRLALRLVAPRSAIRPLDVESAMAKGELTVRFQPQFDINSNALCGAEALARWQHPKLGDIGGAALFSAAGSAGLQAEVSATIWRAAMQAMAQWPATLRGLRVALNATAVDLSDPTLAARLLQMAHHYGVATERLALEVTESSTISQLEQAAANLTALRQAGVHVALDDFGTGYSGLSWLKQLPVDYIKIDSGFARDAGGAPRDRAVLSGIIDLARGLSLDVLAEGVESEQQRDQLAAMGCRWYQGFLRAPALESADFLAFAATA